MIYFVDGVALPIKFKLNNDGFKMIFENQNECSHVSKNKNYEKF